MRRRTIILCVLAALALGVLALVAYPALVQGLASADCTDAMHHRGTVDGCTACCRQHKLSMSSLEEGRSCRCYMTASDSWLATPIGGRGPPRER